MNRHAVRLMREYIEKLAVGDTITTCELAQYVNSNSRCFGATTSEVAHFLMQQELERIAPGVAQGDKMPMRGWNPKPENFIVLQCKTCGAIFKHAHGLPKDVIDAWNRRVKE